MYGHMARGAALVMRIDHAMRGMIRIGDTTARSNAEVSITRMALQAKLGHGWACQQFRIGGPVRAVASDTTIHFTGLVRVEERAAPLHVTLQAGLISIMRLVEHFGGLSHTECGREPAVRVMAIAAFDQPFIDPVFAGQIELRPDVSVALIAVFGLILGEQVLGSSRVMNGVTRGAGNIVLSMF
jgi:hypothetical protein